jgi:c-di-GMP phosphodiesterase
MSSDMLLNAVLEVGIRHISGSHRAFINVTENLLMNPGSTRCRRSASCSRCSRMCRSTNRCSSGSRPCAHCDFEIALDDFVCLPERTALIEHADIVKLDVLAMDRDALARQVDIPQAQRRAPARRKGRNARRCTMICKRLGFDLYQGYYFARPEIYESHRILPNKLVLLELLARVNQPDITPEELGEIIRGDVALSVTVLRWANSSMVGLRTAVESIQRAIVVLGLQTIRNWVSAARTRAHGHDAERAAQDDARAGALLRAARGHCGACECIELLHRGPAVGTRRDLETRHGRGARARAARGRAKGRGAQARR